MIREYLKGSGTTEDFLFNINAGLIDGFRQVRVYGVNTDVDVGTSPEYIWDGQTDYSYPVSNDSINLISSSSSDVLVDVEVTGLVQVGTEWNEQTITVRLNGGTAVPVGNFIRILKLMVVSTIEPVGEVYASTLSTIPTNSSIKAKISLTPNGMSRNVSLMAMYSVPSGYIAFIYRLFSSVRRNEDAEFDYQVRPYGQVFHSIGVTNIFAASQQLEIGYESVTEKSDIRVAVNTLTNNTEARGSIHMILVNNNKLKGIL